MRVGIVAVFGLTAAMLVPLAVAFERTRRSSVVIEVAVVGLGSRLAGRPVQAGLGEATPPPAHRHDCVQRARRARCGRVVPGPGLGADRARLAALADGAANPRPGKGSAERRSGLSAS